MKKFLKIFGIILAILIITVIAVPFLIPLDSYKGQITTVVKEQTGRDLIIDGHIKASIFPVLGVEIGKTSLSNPKGYSEKNMVEIDKLAVEVSLPALLNKKIQVKRFTLSKPVINLEVTDKPNWILAADKTKASDATPVTEENKKSTASSGLIISNAEAAEEKKAEKASSASGSALSGFTIGEVKIIDGTLNYKDSTKKQNINVSKINLKASLPSLSQPLSVDSEATWNSEKITIIASIANPDQLMDGRSSSFAIDFKTAPINLHYVGQASQQTIGGNIDLKIASIPALAKWLGSPLDWKGETPLAFSMQGKLDANASAVALKNAEIALDNIKLKGDIKTRLDDKVPAIETTFASDSININPYIVKQAAEKSSWLVNSAFAAELSNKPIDLSALNSIKAKVSLTVGSILYQKIKLDKTTINADLNDGSLKLNIPSMELYGGSAKVNSTLNSSGAFTKQTNVSNVNIGELLGDATDNHRLVGTLNADTSLTGKLTSVQGMMQTLGGNGSIKITNGAIKGVDLKNMVNNIKSAFTNTDSSQQTAFSELGGTFTINQGVITNNDLALKSDLLKLAGKGTINLAQQTIQYRLSPAVVSTVKNGDGSATSGLEVPIIITGSLDNPHYIPDVAGLVENTIANPAALKNTVKTLKDGFKNGGKAGADDLKAGIGGVNNLLKSLGQ